VFSELVPEACKEFEGRLENQRVRLSGLKELNIPREFQNELSNDVLFHDVILSFTPLEFCLL
jgi:hypothetical protein